MKAWIRRCLLGCGVCLLAFLPGSSHVPEAKARSEVLPRSPYEHLWISYPTDGEPLNHAPFTPSGGSVARAEEPFHNRITFAIYTTYPFAGSIEVYGPERSSLATVPINQAPSYGRRSRAYRYTATVRTTDLPNGPHVLSFQLKDYFRNLRTSTTYRIEVENPLLRRLSLGADGLRLAMLPRETDSLTLLVAGDWRVPDFARHFKGMTLPVPTGWGLLDFSIARPGRWRKINLPIESLLELRPDGRLRFYLISYSARRRHPWAYSRLLDVHIPASIREAVSSAGSRR